MVEGGEGEKKGSRSSAPLPACRDLSMKELSPPRGTLGMGMCAIRCRNGTVRELSPPLFFFSPFSLSLSLSGFSLLVRKGVLGLGGFVLRGWADGQVQIAVMLLRP